MHEWVRSGQAYFFSLLYLFLWGWTWVTFFCWYSISSKSWYIFTILWQAVWSIRWVLVKILYLESSSCRIQTQSLNLNTLLVTWKFASKSSVTLWTIGLRPSSHSCLSFISSDNVDLISNLANALVTNSRCSLHISLSAPHELMYVTGKPFALHRNYFGAGIVMCVYQFIYMSQPGLRLLFDSSPIKCHSSTKHVNTDGFPVNRKKK